MSAPPAGGSQAEPSATAPAATSDTPTQPQAGEKPKLSHEEALAELAEARKEAAKYRTQLRGYESEAEKRRQAELSEVEKRDQRIRELEEGLTAAQQRERDYALRDAIAATVAAEDFPVAPTVSERTIARLLDRDKLQWDDAGNPKNLPALLTELTRTEPRMFAAKPRRPGGGDAGGVQTAPSTADMNSLIRRAGGRQ